MDGRSRERTSFSLRGHPSGLIAGIALLLLAGCMPPQPAVIEPAAAPAAPAEDVASAPEPAPAPLPPSPPPEPAREFRAVWVASVSNIDWPSRRGLPAEQQKAELLRILDDAAGLGLNAVILQVRPAGDALYPSALEPWSEYLTGRMGAPPEPFYDPLQFAIDEAHLRGLELHAWFNPYRARHPSARAPISDSHLSRTRPDLVRTYGTHLWMDPGEPEVQDRTVEVILDVVRRYDVDGVHIDDYFYPYQERNRAGRLIEFPDDDSYRRYRAAGGTLARDDWRRENVNTLVARLYREIKETKRWVKFGISPFGIWRPGYPASVRGLDAYATLYADARKWLADGWVDYFTPQLYWRISAPQQSYPVLLDWWSAQNTFERHLWPGNYIDRVGDSHLWPAEEILSQVEVTRAHPGAAGNVFFSMQTLLRSPDNLGPKLRDAYRVPALVPASPWLDDRRPESPLVRHLGAREGGIELAVEPLEDLPLRWWVVQSYSEGEWRLRLVDAAMRRLLIPAEVDWVAVRGVTHAGVTGEVAVVPVGGGGMLSE